LSQFRKIFLPNRVVSFVEEGAQLEHSSKIIPLLKFKVALKGKSTAYVCEKGMCRLPTVDPNSFAKQLVEVEFLKHSK
jgi:uncharacterized protein